MSARAHVITGVMEDPRNPAKNLTTFNVYLYLTNRRKNTVHILDYELEIDVGTGYEKMERVWGANTIPNWTFTSKTHTMEITNYPEKLITAQAKPIEHGIPLHGFVLFATEKPQHLFLDQVKRYRITCIDAYQNKHILTSRPDQLQNINLLQELAGIKLTPK
jgi:hypothetical protein